MNDSSQIMRNRIAEGLDPLSGRPMETKGVITHRNGVLSDETGRKVELSAFGDWVYADGEKR